MSEYQYYEFVALDGPISDEGLHYARGCSSRATVSRFRWQNVYHFGDFHGSAEKLLNHYDAHLYTANWGTVRLGLAFPKGRLHPEVIQPYLGGGERYEDTLTTKQIGDRFIVWWERNEEGGWGQTEVEGLLDQLVGLREELMGGDYRALFLGWLADFDAEEWSDPKDSAVAMPPVPAGLDRLTRIFVATAPVDLRGSSNRLSSLVENVLAQDPLSGHWFVFTNQRRNRVKILVWDGSGLWVLAKRIEAGRLSWPTAEATSTSLRAEELSALLSGLEVTAKAGWYRR